MTAGLTRSQNTCQLKYVSRHDTAAVNKSDRFPRNGESILEAASQVMLKSKLGLGLNPNSYCLKLAHARITPESVYYSLRGGKRRAPENRRRGEGNTARNEKRANRHSIEEPRVAQIS